MTEGESVIAIGSTFTCGRVHTIDFNLAGERYPHQPFLFIAQVGFADYREDCALRGVDVSDWEHKDGVYYYQVRTD